MGSVNEEPALRGGQAFYSTTAFLRRRAADGYEDNGTAISKVYPEERLASELFQRRLGWSHPIGGTAIEGIEALLAGLLRPGEKVLALVNGPLGRRMAEACERLGAVVILMEQSWGDPIDNEHIERELKRRKPSLLTAAHGEWVTGRCQPLGLVGKVCGELDIRFIADCTATLGRMPVRSEEWRLDAAFGAIGGDSDGAEGAAVVSYNDRILAQLLHRRWGSDRFLNLCDEWRSFKRSPVLNGKEHAFTVQGLQRWMEDRTRMLLLAEERLHAEALEHGMRAMGLHPAIDTGSKLPYAACAAVPKGIDGKRISIRLQEQYGLRLELVERDCDGGYWSVAAIGKQADRCRVLELLAALETELLKGGIRLTRGSAVHAATIRYGREPGRSMMRIGGMKDGETAVCKRGER